MSKSYYETEEYSEAENELDTYDDPVKLVMEYRVNEKHKDKQIADLQHQLKVAEKATKLACDELRVLNYRTFDNADIDFEQQFKEQAEAEINKRSNNDER